MESISKCLQIINGDFFFFNLKLNMVKLNIVRERLVYLAPAVQAGWDDESNVHDFEAVKTLGKGSFGVVRKCRHKKTQKIYAIKELNKKDIKDRNMVQQVRNELKIMYSLNHPNIVKLYSHFEDDLNIYLIMEYAERGQLYQNLMTNPAKKFTEIEVAKIVFQIVEAMKYMH
jgi:serine/threonine protein kinase